MTYDKESDNIILRGVDQESALAVWQIYRRWLFRDETDALPDEVWKKVTKKAKDGFLPDWIEEELDLAEFHALQWLWDDKQGR
jgi:hypothetical protein